MTDKIFLGSSKDHGLLYLEKHSWNCDWYWGFGYIGNSRLHMHISALIKHPEGYNPDWTDVDHHFSSTWLTQNQWWILRDLFISAYAIRKAAEAYHYGGHQTSQAEPYRVKRDGMEATLNEDLGILLDNIWNLLTEWSDAK